MTLVVKSRNDPHAVAPAALALLREMDPGLPLYHVRTLDELLAQSVAQQRFQMLLVASFLLFFLVAAVGTYGVASYGVSERSGELGMRLALGATARDVRGVVLREGARLALAGILIGGVAAVALSQMLSRFLFQVSGLDLITLTFAPLLLGAAALLAMFVPAHRATRVDPLRVLRSDLSRHLGT